MGFLTPLYLAGGVLIALPIVLHWLRRDVAPQVPFTAVHLIRESPIDRSRRRRLRDVLLLAARVAALLLLAASFARPYVLGARSASRSTIVAIDRSYSMNAPGRIDRARALARQAIDDAAASGDRVGVVTFDRRADLLAPLGPAGDARVSLDRVKAGFDGTRYAAVFERAAELLAEEPHGRLVVISDLQRGGFDGGAATLPDGVELIVRDAGSPVENVAVTDVRSEARRVVATLRNFGTVARDVDARVEVNGQSRGDHRVTLPPASSRDLPFDGVMPQGPYAVRVTDDDGYPADNVRYGVAAARGLPKVLIVTGAIASGHGFYVSKALQAGSESAPDFDVRLVTGSAFAQLSPAEVAQQSAIVLLSTHGIDRRVRETLTSFLSAGGGLFIAAGPDIDASVLSTILNWSPELKVQERASSGVLAATDLRHPIFRPFDAVAANLGQVSFQRLWQIETSGTAGWRVVARYTDGAPALVEKTQGPGRILLFTSDIDRRWNNFPVNAAFVPFVQESARYLGARPPGASSILIADAAAGTQPGPAQVDGRNVVVNVDTRESTIDRVSPAEFSKLVARTPADARVASERAGQQAESRQNYWQYGLLLMLGALIAESFVGARY